MCHGEVRGKSIERFQAFTIVMILQACSLSSLLHKTLSSDDFKYTWALRASFRDAHARKDMCTCITMQRCACAQTVSEDLEGGGYIDRDKRKKGDARQREREKLVKESVCERDGEKVCVCVSVFVIVCICVSEYL